MPSRRSRSHSRSRSRSPKRSRHHGRDRDRSESPERRRDLPQGVKPISESDYFQKSDEFRLWLKDEKRKYFDELSGDKARSYFRKFLKAWNKGKLSHKYYDGLTPGSLPATTNTSYKWSFASKSLTKADDAVLRATRASVGAVTYNQEPDSDGDPAGPSRPSGSGRLQGPTLPSASDLTYTSEMLASQRLEESKYKHARNKKETKERIEEMVGPKPMGREGMLEKKALRREGDRAFRDAKGDEGLEVDESTLMGGGDSFKATLQRRDMGKKRYEQKQEEKVNAIRERSAVIREKEKATMDMFQQLAKQRFG